MNDSIRRTERWCWKSTRQPICILLTQTSSTSSKSLWFSQRIEIFSEFPHNKNKSKWTHIGSFRHYACVRSSRTKNNFLLLFSPLSLCYRFSFTLTQITRYFSSTTKHESFNFFLLSDSCFPFIYVICLGSGYIQCTKKQHWKSLKIFKL